MGLHSFFKPKPGCTITPPPRTCCAKCGKPLGFRWRQGSYPADAAFCRLCKWLLRFADSERPDEETLREIGLPTTRHERQLAEPIPAELLRVQDWPEVDSQPRVKQRFISLDDFVGRCFDQLARN